MVRPWPQWTLSRVCHLLYGNWVELEFFVCCLEVFWSGLVCWVLDVLEVFFVDIVWFLFFFFFFCVVAFVCLSVFFHLLCLFLPLEREHPMLSLFRIGICVN